MIHICDIILERLDVIDVVDLVLIELTHFLLHSASFGYQILDYEIHVVVGSLEVDDLTVHVGDLFSHFGYFFLSRADISLEFFDLVIQDEFELFELLGFLFEFVDTCHLVSYGLFALFYLLGLGLLSL